LKTLETLYKENLQMVH